jgi:hypothetical protein
MIKLLAAADILSALVFAWRFSTMPEEIPLFYSKQWGEAQIVDYWYIFLIPLLMHLFYFVNVYISKKYLKDERLLRKLFSIVNIINIVLFTGIYIKILLLVS